MGFEILPGRQGPTLADAIGQLQNAITGHQQAQQDQDAAEQKAALIKAQQDYYGARTAKTQAETDPITQINRIMNTPYEQLTTPWEREVKLKALGLGFGEAGGKANTALATQGVPAMVDSSQVSSGATSSDFQNADIAERNRHNLVREGQTGSTASATVTLRGKQGKVADARAAKLNAPPTPKATKIAPANADVIASVKVLETRAGHLEDAAAKMKDPTIKQNTIDAANQLRARANVIKRTAGLMTGTAPPEVQQPVPAAAQPQGRHLVVQPDGSFLQVAQPPTVAQPEAADTEPDDDETAPPS